ncbi:MAG: molybdopterin converting factor subunit 1 [Microscillaceae bacterium]|jgi:molybdopterin synthase sulfur carrier subunit|nr:molybdopterin converting factor subunit 1 [Microscillaceae bacterium]
MNIQIQLFGITRDIVGQNQCQVSLTDSATVADLLQQLKIDYPELARLSSLLVAVNSEYADNQTLIRLGDEVALIPPVSGG